jgi:hypothetical protein
MYRGHFECIRRFFMQERAAVAAIGLLTLFTATASAETAARRPWEWTDAERIAERTSPDRVRERVAEAAANILATQGAKPGTYLMGDSLDGNKHPELFLPIELFEFLVSGTMTIPEDMRVRRRASFEKRSRQKLPANFWHRLESMVATYATTVVRARELNARSAAASGDEQAQLREESRRIQAGQCRELHDGLERARAEFGRAFFDRFLYETVPYGAGITFAGVPTAAQLTAMIEGCK